MGYFPYQLVKDFFHQRTNTFKELNQRGEGQIKNITLYTPKTESALHLDDFKNIFGVEVFTPNIWGSDQFFQLDGV